MAAAVGAIGVVRPNPSGLCLTHRRQSALIEFNRQFAANAPVLNGIHRPYGFGIPLWRMGANRLVTVSFLWIFHLFIHIENYNTEDH